MITVAIIGCGGWGPNHIRTFSTIPGCYVKSVADLELARRNLMAGMFPEMRSVSDYRTLLDDPEIDAVVVATPTSTHPTIVRAALLAGKHVLCEKPLCTTASTATELVECASIHGRVLMVGHIFLFNAGIIRLKELLVSGEIGIPHYLSAVRTNLGPIRHDVNVAYDLATHDVAIFNWLLDAQPERIATSGGSFLRPGVEDVVFINMRYPGNILANIHASWLNPRKVRHITIVGSRKMVTWDDLELKTSVAIYDCGASTTPAYTDYGEFLRISMWDGEVRLPKLQIEEPMKVQARHFLECVSRGRADISNGAFSIGVVKALESVADSLADNSNCMLPKA